MYSKRIHPTDRPVGSSVHESRDIERTFVTQAISEIPELSHGIQDRRPRHSKHPSPLAMPVVFSYIFYQSWAGSQNLLQSVAKPLSHGFLPWMLVTLMTMFAEGTVKRRHEDISPSSLTTNTTRDIPNPPTYLESDYRDVQFWTTQKWKDNESSIKDRSDLDTKAGQCRGGRAARGENVMLMFLEHENGKMISGGLAREVRDFARDIWKGFYGANKA